MTFTLYKNNREPSVTTQIKSGHNPVDLTAASGVKFRMRPRSSTTLTIDSNATITDPAQGLVRYDWGPSDTTTPGEFFAWFTVTTSGRDQDTPEFDIEILEHAGSSGSNLCTVDDVRAVLQSEASDIGQNDELLRLIPAASKAIMSRCEREFAPAVDGVTRTIAHYGGRRLIPAPYDLRVVTSMVFDPTTTNPVTLVADNDYSVSPLDRDGVVRWIDLAHYTYQWRGYTCPRYLQITGNWGYPSVPVDVAQAAAVTVASWLDRSTSDYAGLAEGGGIDTTPSTGANYGIPAGAYRLLLPYIRLAVA